MMALCRKQDGLDAAPFRLQQLQHRVYPIHMFVL
jgi:hypothetical protein